MSPSASISPADPGAAEPIVSAIVSTYNAESFIRGALGDLVRQTLGSRLEIIVIDSGSEQNEAAIVSEFQRDHHNIRYIRTRDRETVYAAWNRGVRVARGRYLTNANTDDRHREDALAVMAQALDAHPEVGLVYADSLITKLPNETFEATTAQARFRWPDYSIRQTLGFNLFGPQPMWRRSIHETLGSFDPAYVVAGDYDLFLAAAWRFGALHLPQTLGLYLQGPGVEHSNADLCRGETRQILEKYRSAIPLEDVYPGLRASRDPERDAALARVDFGNSILQSSHPDLPLVELHYRIALESLGRSSAVLNNLAIVRLLRRDLEGCRSLLEESAALGESTADKNRAALAGGVDDAPELSLVALRDPLLDALPPLVTGHAVQSLHR